MGTRGKFHVFIISFFISFVLILSARIVPLKAQVTPPDLGICDGITCDVLPDSLCSDAGFEISLINFIPPNVDPNGSATYVYKICSPGAGECDSGPVIGNSCLEQDDCSKSCNINSGKCQGTSTACTSDADCVGTCNRPCAVDDFHGLSHFDILFPQLGGVDSCLSAENTVSGSCACSSGSSASCSVNPTVVLGDGSCFDSGGDPNPQSFVAKCDNTNLLPGDCIEMTLTIAGELTDLGLGTSIVVDKEANTCTSSCVAGPACGDDRCDEDTDGEECLTRTIGFWGTHPWITNNYVPVTVCGKSLGCSGADDGESNPACLAGTCDSVMEGLCSVPGQELPSNQAYVTLVRQLTAAKLNLNATAALSEGGTCSTWSYNEKTIQEWIAFCEGKCGANKSEISNSGCIEALDAFNNSLDTGFAVTPAPFDRPPVDDHGNISGADHSQCSLAQGNSKKTKLVIGKIVGSQDCH